MLRLCTSAALKLGDRDLRRGSLWKIREPGGGGGGRRLAPGADSLSFSASRSELGSEASSPPTVGTEIDR